MKKFDWLSDDIALKEKDFEIDDKIAFIKDFVFSSAITLIYSPPKQGKTWLAYAMALRMIERDDIEVLIYLDMDNSLSTLKERGVEAFITKQKVNYITRAKLTNEPMELLKNIAKEATIGAYDKVVFFIDTIKDFIDTDNKNQATEFMSYLVKIRDAGGTIIVLHHATKNGRNISGNSVFINTPDNVFEMAQQGKVNTNINFTLRVTHARGLVKDVKYSVDTNTLLLSDYDAVASGLSETDKVYVEKALQVLEDADDGLSKSKLVEAMGLSRTDRRGKALADEMVGYYWRLEQINPKLTKYYLMEEK